MKRTVIHGDMDFNFSFLSPGASDFNRLNYYFNWLSFTERFPFIDIQVCCVVED